MLFCGAFSWSQGGAAANLALKEMGIKKLLKIVFISQVLMVLLSDVVPKPLPTPVVGTRVEDFNFVVLHGCDFWVLENNGGKELQRDFGVLTNEPFPTATWHHYHHGNIIDLST